MFSSKSSLPIVQVEFNSFGVRTTKVGNIKLALFPPNSKLKFTLLANETGDAVVFLQGKEVGTYRLQANTEFRIERPGKKDIGLYVIEVDSKKGKQCGLKSGSPENGEFKVVFKPQLYRMRTFESRGQTRSAPLHYPSKGRTGRNTRSVPFGRKGGNTPSVQFGSRGGNTQSANVVEAGFVGKGTTGQEFGSAPKLSLDLSRQVIIKIRIGIDKDDNMPEVFQSLDSCLHGDTGELGTIGDCFNLNL